MQNSNQTKLEALLSNTDTIVKEHHINVKEKGEDFNIFSILKMEKDETKTHSRMIVALLDPKGNHYQNEVFLKLFLDEINYDFKDENLKLVKIKAEYNLGPIPVDYSKGGFIDILITFPSGKAIAIENKIDAVDQPKQIYRYSLYKVGLSTLYYLNKFGKHPEKCSLHTLTDKDYNVISYNNHVINWLDKCIEIVTPSSIIENALKQYQILIKKITNSMDKNLENNLENLILNNIEEAKYISSHYQKAVDSIKERFRIAIYDELIKNELKVFLGKDSSNNYSTIWIDSSSTSMKGARIGIESFSGQGYNNGRLFIGILHKNILYNILAQGDERMNIYWPVIRDIKTPENNPLNLSSSKILEQLNSDNIYFNNMVQEVVFQVKEFVNTYDRDDSILDED